METKWSSSLDIKDPYHPIITVVIKSWHPFIYAVTLKATIHGEIRDVRRWDNINKPDHVDIFYISGKVEKHQKIPLGKITGIRGIKRLGEYIEERYQHYIRQFESK
jgi:hypothetical protein